jgi:formate C-acetyltransferase
MTYLVLQAFFLSNNPQPALSVKLHRNTPEEIYRRMGEFFFTPGHSTPSLFNDDMMFKLLGRKGIRRGDRSDYAIAGCQEPLVTGKENANTTNSWLNLAKILELTLNDGKSLISGTKIGLSWRQLGYRDFAAVCQDIETAYWKQFDHLAGRMVLAANNCVKVLGKVAVPFSSAVQGCLATGRDMRHATRPGTAYSGSGCLVHGLSVLTDSLIAVKQFMKSGTVAPADLLVALRTDFLGQDRLREFLLSAEKYGNNCPGADRLAARLAKEVSRRISAYRNPAGFPFTPDFSTPTTHLLYGYWVGATPDGRKAREMLGYGIDPRPGVARKGLQERMLSTAKLPFASFTGGYASHIGLAPRDFAGMPRKDEKGMALRDRVISPLFGFAEGADGPSPFYVYFNIDDATHLRKVMEQPGKHAPSGVYIMRIHGTFVNFLDLSPAIQEDILARLDPPSTALGR